VTREVQRVLKLAYLSSVIQARICHSKGLWYYRPGSKPGKWIQIRASQRKLTRLDRSDPGYRTLNINNVSVPAKSAHLYTGFIPVLHDRGVPTEAMLGIARHQVRLEGEEFVGSLKRGDALQHWISSQKDVMGSRRSNGGRIAASDGWPRATDERALYMLQVGFEATKLAYLRTLVLDIAKHVFNSKAKRLRIRLAKSTSVLGIVTWRDLLFSLRAYQG